MMNKPAHYNKPTSLYRIDFVDGAVYIGITCMDLDKRMSNHKRNPVNPKVAYRMREGISGTATVLRVYKHRYAAQTGEMNAINSAVRNGENVLNGLDVYGRAFDYRNHHKRTAGDAFCYWCKETLPAAEFYSDRSRTNGLMSRCKTCDNVRRRYIGNAMVTGRCTSAAYQEAKVWCGG